MGDSIGHVSDWLKIRIPKQEFAYALGYRFKDACADPWTERFNSVKYIRKVDLGAVPSAVTKMVRVLEEAVVALLSDLNVPLDQAAFIPAISSYDRRVGNNDVVAYLARLTARKTGANYLPHALSKEPYKPMHKQGLDLEQRRYVQGKANYRCATMVFRHVFVFDDVITTGSTLGAIFDAIHKANSDIMVYGVSLAKAEKMVYSLKSNSHIPQLWEDIWTGAADRRPSEVVDLKPSLVQLDKIRISWRPPIRFGRRDSALYEVQCQYSDGNKGKIDVDINEPSNEAYVDDSFGCLGRRTYEVRAVNDDGPGPWSYVAVDSKFLARQITSLIAVSSGLQVKRWNASVGKLGLSWDTGLPIYVNYRLERSSDGVCTYIDCDTSYVSVELPLAVGSFHRFRLMVGHMGVWEYCSDSLDIVIAVGDPPPQGVPPLEVPSGGLIVLYKGNMVQRIMDQRNLIALFKDAVVGLTCRIVDVDTAGLRVTWGSIQGFVPFAYSQTGLDSEIFDRIGRTEVFIIKKIPRLNQLRQGSLLLRERGLELVDRAIEDPWKTVTVKYPVGLLTIGVIQEITNFGAYVELDREITGLIHVSEFRKTGGIKNAEDVVAKGMAVQVKVLSIDHTNRSLALGFRGQSL